MHLYRVEDLWEDYSTVCIVTLKLSLTHDFWNIGPLIVKSYSFLFSLLLFHRNSAVPLLYLLRLHVTVNSRFQLIILYWRVISCIYLKIKSFKMLLRIEVHRYPDQSRNRLFYQLKHAIYMWNEWKYCMHTMDDLCSFAEWNMKIFFNLMH